MGDRQWSRASQALQRLTIESDKLRAIVNGLRRVLSEDAGFEIKADAAARSRFQLELEANERDLEDISAEFRNTATRSRWAACSRASAISASSTTTRCASASRSCSRARWRWWLRGKTTRTRVEYARSIQPLLARADVVDQRSLVAERREREDRGAPGGGRSGARSTTRSRCSRPTRGASKGWTARLAS